MGQDLWREILNIFTAHKFIPMIIYFSSFIYSMLNTLGFRTWTLTAAPDPPRSYFETWTSGAKNQPFPPNLYSQTTCDYNYCQHQPKMSLGFIETARRINIHIVIFTACVQIEQLIAWELFALSLGWLFSLSFSLRWRENGFHNSNQGKSLHWQMIFM